MIQFDDSSSKSMQDKPLQHASKHAQPISESEEELKEPLNPSHSQQQQQKPASGRNTPIIFEDPLLEAVRDLIKQKIKKPTQLLMDKNTSSDSESNLSSSTSSSLSTTLTDSDTNTSDDETLTKTTKKGKKNEKGTTMKQQKKETKKRKPTKPPVQKKRKSPQKRKLSSENARVVKKAKRIFQKALKELKRNKQ